MDEDDLLAAREDQIRRARQVIAMKPIPVAQSMGNSADNQFWLSMLRLHPA
jgi:hypothetical protein